MLISLVDPIRANRGVHLIFSEYMKFKTEVTYWRHRNQVSVGMLMESRMVLMSDFNCWIHVILMLEMWLMQYACRISLT